MAEGASPTTLFLQSIRRDLNCVTDPDRGVRRKALEKLHKTFLQQDDNLPCLQEFQEAWDNVILPVMLNALHDHVEKCRELSINVMHFVVKTIQVEHTITLVVPILVDRIGRLPLIEDSEEIRLLLIKLVKSLLSKCSLGILAMNLDSLSQVLSTALADQFHEIKKVVCDVVALIVSRNDTLPPQAAERLVKAILSNLSHPHSKVRVASLQSINSLMQCSLPNHLIEGSVIPTVQKLAFDRVEKVRMLLFQCVAEWLGYGHDAAITSWEESSLDMRILQFLPVLLLGIFDESLEVRCNTLLWTEGVGKLYHAAHQKPGLREIDESAQDEEYQRLLPAPFTKRPGKGCRQMVQDLFKELVEPVKNNIQDWGETTKCGAARLLHTLVIMAEGHARSKLHVLIPTLCSAVGDENLSVAKAIVGSTHMLGWHASPPEWLPLVLNHISSPVAALTQVANGLVVFSGLLYGTQKQAVDEVIIQEVVKQLKEINLRFSQHTSIHHQTLTVLTNLVKVGGSCCNTCLSEMLIIVIQVQCFGLDPGLEQEVLSLEALINHAVGFSSTKDLYANQADCLFKLVTPEHESWSMNSYKQALFQKLLHKVGALAGPYIQGLLPVFKSCLQQDGDPTLRIQLLQLLDELFEMSELGLFWSSVAVVVLSQILVPCGVWRVGKVGAAVRHGAMVALGTFLRQDLCNQKDLDALLQSDHQMLPIVLSCMGEDYYADVRMVTCHVLENILRISGTSLSEKQREDVRKALENRLDDSNDNVRLRALQAIATFFGSMPSIYNDGSVRSFVNNILLHMDDNNNQIQESVFKALQVCTSLRPAIVEELVKQNCGHHEMRGYCDFLLAKARCLQDTEEDFTHNRQTRISH